MSYDIGPKIGIEGEAEFRSAINQINTGMKTLGTEMQAVASQFDKNDKSTDALTAKNEVLNKQIDLQKQKLSELSKGLAASADKYGENDKVTQGWQQAVNKATADLNSMERELGNNNKTMADFGTEEDRASEKTGKFGAVVATLGKGLANVGKVAAKAAIVGITAVGTAAVGAAAGALKLAKDVGKTADDLITLSNQTGISTQQLQEWDYAMRFIDVPMETMTKSMAKLVKGMDNASKGGKDTTEAFSKLGVSWKDNEGKMRNNQDVFNDLIGALGKIENETERDALSMRLFGKSAQELNPLIKAGSEELARLSEEAHQVGAVLSDDALAAAGKFDDMMETLGASTKGLVATLGVAVIPAVTEVVNSVVGVVPKITEAIKTGDWSGAGQAVTDGLNGLLGKITGALPGLATMGSTILGSIAGAIVTAVPEVIPPLIQATLMLLNTLIEVFIANGPMLIDAAIEAIIMIVQGLTDALPKVIEAAIVIITTLISSILDQLPELIPVALSIIIALVMGLIDALPKLIQMVPKIVETIVKVIIDNLPLILGAALQIIIALAGALITNIPLIIKSVIEIIGSILKGLVDGIKSIITFVPKLFTTLVKEFKTIKWGELGSNIISGIVKGVGGAAKSLAVSVVDTAKNALKAVKKFLGISSPSKVMANEIGKNIPLGVAKGIDDNAETVEEAAKRMFEGSKNWIDERKYYNELSLADELAAWERVQARYKQGTEERKAADREVYRVKKEIYNQLKAASDDYYNKVREVNENLAREEQRLTEAYNKEVENRANQIMGFTGLFGEVNKEKVSGNTLVKNLKDQVRYMEDWAKNIDKLAERGIDDGLLEELRNMGPSAGNEIAALTKLSDKKLQEYEELWQSKSEIAHTQAISELEGLRIDTEYQIDELKRESAIKLDELAKEFSGKIKGIRTSTETEFTTLSNNMPQMGANIISGLIQGLESMTEPLLEKAREIASSVATEMEGALGIASPSRVMRDRIGKMIGAGIAEGITASTRQVDAAMAGLNNRLVADGSIAPQTGTSRSAGTTKVFHEHKGRITIEGANDREHFREVVEIIKDEFRREARSY